MSKVTSFNLRYGKLQLEEIKSQVNEILIMINDLIVEAHDRCETKLIVPLPFNFDIPNLTKLSARKKIYALIIEDLTSPKRGFTVSFLFISILIDSRKISTLLMFYFKLINFVLNY